ncbi:MAG: helix-turn-helix domain-containing protein [Pseudomonadota bacterium]
MRIATVITLSQKEKQRLSRLARSNTSSVREARRASIILMAAQGKTNQEIAEELGVGRVQIGRWRQRYVDGGWNAIACDHPRGGRPSQIDAQEIIRLTTLVLNRSRGSGCQHHALVLISHHADAG